MNTLGRMDASEKWMIIWFTPHQTPTLPKWMFFQNFSSNHLCCYSKWLVWHSSTSPKQQRRPLPSLLSLSFFYAIGTGKEKTRVLNSHLAESVEQTRSKVLLLLMLWLDDDSCCCWQLLLAGRRRSSWSVSPWDTSSSCSWVSSWRACSSSLWTCKSWLTYCICVRIENIRKLILNENSLVGWRESNTYIISTIYDLHTTPSTQKCWRTLVFKFQPGPQFNSLHPPH